MRISSRFTTALHIKPLDGKRKSIQDAMEGEMKNDSPADLRSGIEAPYEQEA